MTRRTGRHLTLGAAFLLVTLWATMVWPTAYRPFSLRGGGRSVLAARQQRFTGVVDVLTLDGWQPLGPVDTMRPPVDPLVSRMRALAAEPR